MLMHLNRRQLMRIACTISNTTIQAKAVEWGVTDVAVHHFLNGKTFNGKRSKNIPDKFDEFIKRSFNKCNMADGKTLEIAAA